MPGFAIPLLLGAAGVAIIAIADSGSSAKRGPGSGGGAPPGGGGGPGSGGAPTGGGAGPGSGGAGPGTGGKVIVPKPCSTVDMEGVCIHPLGKDAQAGIASNPLYQHLYKVQPGDSPAAISAKVFGTDRVSEWVKLIQANPTDYLTKRHLGSEGDPGNPMSGDPPYNFESLNAGDTLALPRSWNLWIDQKGIYRHGSTPFPIA